VSRRGYTSKPCPGCGRSKERKPEEVCEDCKALIAQAKAHNEWAAKLTDTETELVRVPEEHNTHAYPQFYMGSPRSGRTSRDDGPRRQISNLLARLINQISEPVRNSVWGTGAAILSNAEGPFNQRGWSRNWENARHLRTMPKATAQTIRDLYDAVANALVETHELSKRDGRNLLFGLAEGDVSVNDFNKATINDYEK